MSYRYIEYHDNYIDVSPPKCIPIRTTDAVVLHCIYCLQVHLPCCASWGVLHYTIVA